jgi:hypothetical protein
MNKRLFSIVILLAVVLVGISTFFIVKKLLRPQKIHYHAGFVVFQNNKKLDFSDNKYMFIEPCTLNKKDDASGADIQIEKAHLHENVGELVHVERTGAKWQDLFTNIHFPINYSQTTGFINGKQINDYQLDPIKPYDSLAVFIGKNDSRLLSQAVTKQYIIKMAKKSTTCGD